jgi:hypothetical protein
VSSVPVIMWRIYRENVQRDVRFSFLIVFHPFLGCFFSELNLS